MRTSPSPRLSQPTREPPSPFPSAPIGLSPSQMAPTGSSPGLTPHQDGEVSDPVLGCRILMLCVETQLDVAANLCAQRLHLNVQEVP